MGRLRNDREAPLFRGVAEEVVDLFGVPDAYLFRFSSADNLSNKDPLWSEPSTTARFTRYPIKVSYSDYDDSTDADDAGRDMTLDVNLYVSLNHLLKAQVPKDGDGDYVTEGDVVGFHWRGEYIEADVLVANHDGWVNDTDSFTGYTLTCKRRDKYVTERKTGDD